MKVYTKTGDAGKTSLVGGTRVSKASVRLEAYGTVDELNSSVGLLLAMDGVPSKAHEMLTRVQHLLFNLGSQLATEPDSRWKPEGVAEADVEMLEKAIDEITATLPPKFRFVLPGGCMAAAQANVSRTVARRAERRMIAMAEDGEHVAPEAMRFINRLSDYLFVLARHINIVSGTEEIFWER